MFAIAAFTSATSLWEQLALKWAVLMHKGTAVVCSLVHLYQEKSSSVEMKVSGDAPGAPGGECTSINRPSQLVVCQLVPAGE